MMKGQVAIIVLLVSAIVMSVGLSVSKRTVVETRIDSDEEQLKQAFNAAESGIEYYLKTNQKNYTASDNNSTSEVQTSPLGDGDSSLNFGSRTLSDETTYFWLVAHNSNGEINFADSYNGDSLNICVSTDYNGGLKVDYFYRTGVGNYNVWRTGFNVNSSTVEGYTNTNPPQGSCPSGFQMISLGGAPLNPGTIVPLMLAVRPIADSTNLILLGTDDFPIQGEEITSRGLVGNKISQVVKIYRQFRIPVFMLDSITVNNAIE